MGGECHLQQHTCFVCPPNDKMVAPCMPFAHNLRCCNLCDTWRPQTWNFTWCASVFAPCVDIRFNQTLETESQRQCGCTWAESTCWSPPGCLWSSHLLHCSAAPAPRRWSAPEISRGHISDDFYFCSGKGIYQNRLWYCQTNKRHTKNISMGLKNNFFQEKLWARQD